MVGSGVFEKVKKPKVLERKLWKTSKSREEGKGVPKLDSERWANPREPNGDIGVTASADFFAMWPFHHETVIIGLCGL